MSLSFQSTFSSCQKRWGQFVNGHEYSNKNGNPLRKFFSPSNVSRSIRLFLYFFFNAYYTPPVWVHVNHSKSPAQHLCVWTDAAWNSKKTTPTDVFDRFQPAAPPLFPRKQNKTYTVQSTQLIFSGFKEKHYRKLFIVRVFFVLFQMKATGSDISNQNENVKFQKGFLFILRKLTWTPVCITARPAGKLDASSIHTQRKKTFVCVVPTEHEHLESTRLAEKATTKGGVQFRRRMQTMDVTRVEKKQDRWKKKRERNNK